jgi:glycosyltransferase involved in cell wall biosynthesis
MNHLNVLDSFENKAVGNETIRKPYISLVIPAYNEEALIEDSLTQICNYMKTLERKYYWELILVNDGSSDRTGEIAEAFSKSRPNVFILHHFVNFHIGQALRFAFNNCKGDYIVTMDLDLSYSPEHIERLIETIIEARAKIVVASPYMKGGSVSNVPWMRSVLSKYANKFLSMTAASNISTLTGMVRAYDRKFIKSLNLKAMDYEINPEIIYKAQLLRARIVEIPAELNWGFQKAIGKSRHSSMRVIRNIISCVFSGFIFRPFMFFVVPGTLLLMLSMFTLVWVLIHTWEAYLVLPKTTGAFDTFTSAALAAAFQKSPHTFVVGGVSLMVSIQLLSLGILASQHKRYFEELFHLGTSIYKAKNENSNIIEHNNYK